MRWQSALLSPYFVNCYQCPRTHSTVCTMKTETFLWCDFRKPRLTHRSSWFAPYQRPDNSVWTVFSALEYVDIWWPCELSHSSAIWSIFLFWLSRKVGPAGFWEFQKSPNSFGHLLSDLSKMTESICWLFIRLTTLYQLHSLCSAEGQDDLWKDVEGSGLMFWN
jgi:hypothetical protein